jgi:hypothetical protein
MQANPSVKTLAEILEYIFPLGRRLATLGLLLQGYMQASSNCIHFLVPFTQFWLCSSCSYAQT